MNIVKYILLNTCDYMKICTFVFILLLSLKLFSQTSGRDKTIADSLKNIIETSDSSQKVDALIRLSTHYMFLAMNHDVQQDLRFEALKLAQEIKDTLLQIRANEQLIHEFFRRGKLDEVKQYIDKNLTLSRKFGLEEISTTYMVIYESYSRYFNGREQYDSALYYAEKSIQVAESLGDCIYLFNRYLYLSKIYLKTGDRDAELQAYLDGYNITKSCNDLAPKTHLAVFSRQLGYLYMTRGEYSRSLVFFKEADTIYSNFLNDNRNKSFHALQASNIARVYHHWGKLDSAMKYRQLAVHRFLEYGFNERNINIPNQYCYMGMIYREWGALEKARNYIERSLELRKEIGDSLGVGMSLDEMAILARIEGKYQQALGFLNESLVWKSCVLDGRIEALRYAQQIESQSETYLLFGQVFMDWGKIDDAIYYLDTAQMYANAVKYTRGESIIEYYRGLAYQKAGSMDSASRHFQISLHLAEEIDNRPLFARARTGLGLLSHEQGQYGQARNELETALNIYIEGGFTRELPEIYLYLGRVYLKRGDEQKAMEVFTKAHEESERMGMLLIHSEAAMELAGLYDSSGNYALSNTYLREYIELHDSIFTLTSHRQLAEMQAFHESQQQQLQIRQLEQTNELNNLRAERSQYIIISLGGIVVIILLFAVLFIRQIRIRNEQLALINQQRLFRSQMNPHFIFNSLTNIQHYIFSKDSLSAGKYLAIFAKLMRGILNHSQRELISLRDEIDTISQYLELQQLRMEDKLHFEVKVDESLDVELIEIPPMLAQPFIENSIEHGIRNLEGPGKVTVRIKKEVGYILYEVEDNGVGRKKAAELKSEKHRNHESMAVALTRTRLQNLWGRKNPGKVFEVVDLKTDSGEPCGTLVRFKVPFS